MRIYWSPNIRHLLVLMVLGVCSWRCQQAPTDASVASPDAARADTDNINHDGGVVQYTIPPNTSRTSSIRIFSYQIGTTATSRVTADLFDQSPPNTTRISASDPASSCTVLVTEFDPRVGLPVFADAGPISVIGGLSPIEIFFNDVNYAAYASGDSALFTGGETLQLTAVGGSKIGAFSTELTAPTNLQLTSPSIAPGNALDITRSDQLTFQWTGGNADTSTQVHIKTRPPEATFVDILCSWPSTLGEGSIPLMVMQKLPAGAGTITVRAINATSTMVEDWGPIECIAETPATTPDGFPVDVEVDIK